MVRYVSRGFLWVATHALLIGSALGLVWANFHNETYVTLTHLLHFPVNDIGMVAFFGIAGKEIREAMLPGGDLQGKRAALPLIATLGGVVVPAGMLFVLAYVFMPEFTPGWAVPTATDIAYTATIATAVFGAKHAATTYLKTIAVADDAIGLIVLAIFFTVGEMHLALLAGLVAVAMLIARDMNKKGTRSVWPYFFPITLSWFGFYLGGVHPAMAAIPVVFMLPHAKTDQGIFEPAEEDNRAKGDTLGQFEHVLALPTKIILGLFGLVNAGVVVTSVGVGAALFTICLMVGKPLGIVGFTKIGQLFGLSLPPDMNNRHLLVLGSLAGIGFTVSLLFADCSFAPGLLQDAAKMGALLSLGAIVVALLLAKLLGIRKAEVVQQDKEEASRPRLVA